MQPEHPSAPSQRRLVLRAATKLLGIAALLAIAWVLASSAFAPGQRPDTESFTVDLAALEPGQVRSVQWDGRLLLVLHRSAAMIEALQRPNPTLTDPGSSRSHQPETARTPFRSLRPEYLVLLGHGTDLGCPVDWVGPEAEDAPEPWYGGFRDRCRGSWYDLAGRAYANQPATRNLTVPAHRFSGAALLHLD